MWDWGFDKPKHIDILHANSIGLAFFSIPMLWFREPHLIDWRERIDPVPIHTGFLLSIEILIAFEQLIAKCLTTVIFTRTENGLKKIIKDNMKLRANINSTQTPDICH